MKRLNITISGLVQGVSFRYYTRDKANSLGIFGFVKNMSDGTVYLECQGEEDKLEEFVDWCRLGPDAAQVKKLDIVEAEPKNFDSFDIK